MKKNTLIKAMSQLSDEHIAEFVTDILTQIADKGVNPVLKKKNLKATYKKYCE